MAGGAESSRSMKPSKSEMGSFCGAGSVWSSWAPVPASLWYMASAWSRVVVLHSFQDEHYCVSARKLAVKMYGVGQDSGRYTMPVDECDPGCAVLPGDHRLPAGVDIAVVDPHIFSDQRCLAPRGQQLTRNVCAAEPSSLPCVPQPRASDTQLPAGGL